MRGYAASLHLSSSLCLNSVHARVHSLLENPPVVRWPRDLVGKLTCWLVQVVTIRKTGALLQIPRFCKN